MLWREEWAALFPFFILHCTLPPCVCVCDTPAERREEKDPVLVFFCLGVPRCGRVCLLDRRTSFPISSHRHSIQEREKKLVSLLLLLLLYCRAVHSRISSSEWCSIVLCERKERIKKFLMTSQMQPTSQLSLDFAVCRDSSSTRTNRKYVRAN